MQMTRKVAAVAVVCLLARMPLVAQTNVASRDRLRIIPLEGNNAVNHIPTQAVTAPVVEVRDENDRPVEGAVVVFKLPGSGAGGNFGDGQASQTVITDIRGQAEAKNFQINATPGRFVIDVTASYQGRSGQLLVSQTNSMVLPELPSERAARVRSGRLKWLWIGAAAVGGSLAVYFATKGGADPIGVSLGPVTVGGPQ